MPGYYVHLAACPSNTLKNRTFVLGAESPDLLHKYYKMYGEKAAAKFNVLRTKQTPEFSQLRSRVVQEQRIGSNQGLHYGTSKDPDVRTCWKEMKERKGTENNPFERGYIWHLLTDKLVYSRLDIMNKFQKAIKESNGKVKPEELRKKMHDDWDRTNAYVRDTYPEVLLTEEIKELNIVHFVEEKPIFIDLDILKETIDYLRGFDPLNGNMDEIIEEILFKIKQESKSV